MTCDLAIDKGNIFKIGKSQNMPEAECKIDLENKLVLPGLIDCHVHLRDQGKAYKEDFYTGTAAAAAGGITTVLDMPNNEPVTMSAEALNRRMELSEGKKIVDVGFYSEFPRDSTQIKEIVQDGAIAFKLYLAEKIGGLNLEDDTSIRKALKTVSRLKIPVAVHAEDRTTLKKAEDRIKNGKSDDIEAFLKVHSEEAEVEAIKRMLKLAEQTNVQLHFCHISTDKGLKKIMDAKKSGKPVTCEATPHHLFLSTKDLMEIGFSALTVPPIRGKRHISALWEGINNGWIDILASDHAPHIIVEKKVDSVWGVEAGVPNLETMLPLLLTAVKMNRLSITEIVSLLSEKPAKIFGLNNKGYLREGKRADLIVVDLNEEYVIDASKFHSKAKYSPFDGWRVQGKPVKTFVDGQLVMDGGKITGRRPGRIIRGKNV